MTTTNKTKTLSDIEYAISVRLKRSNRHHCYTEGLTVQRANQDGWKCGHCGQIVESLTDANVAAAFSAITARNL